MPVYRIPVHATYSGVATITADTQEEAIALIEDGDWQGILLDDLDDPNSVVVNRSEVDDEEEEDDLLEVDEEEDEDEDDEYEDEDEEDED